MTSEASGNGALPRNEVATAQRVPLPDRLGVWFIAALAALPALILYPFPSQDGHQHAFTAFAMTRLGDPALGFGRYLELNIPLSSQGYVLLLAVLDGILPFTWAERGALALTLAAFPLSGAVAARWTRRPILPVAGMMALVAHGWVLAMGFYNFMLAFALVPLVLALAVRALQRPHARPALPDLGLGLAILVLAWFHLVVAVFAGLILLTAALSLPSDRRVRHALGFCLAGIPGALYAILVFQQHAPDSLGNAGSITSMEPVFLSTSVRLAEMFRAGPGGISPGTGLVFLATCIASVVTVLLCRSANRRFARAALILAGILLLAYVLSPIQAFRWAFLSHRILFGAFFIMSLVGFEIPKRSWPRALVVLLVAVGLSSSLLSFARLHQRLEPYDQAMAEVPHAPGQTLFALDMADARHLTTIPHFLPTLHLSARILMRSGGITPHLFAINPVIHSVTYRGDPSMMLSSSPALYIRRGLDCGDLPGPACRSRRLELADRLATYGLRWGEILLFNSTELLSGRLVQRGYEPLYDNGAAVLFRAHPSRLALILHVPAGPLPSDLVVHLGLWESLGPIQGFRLPRGRQSSGEERAEAHLLPAGPLGMVIFLDRDQDDRPASEEILFETDELLLTADRTTSFELTIDHW